MKDSRSNPGLQVSSSAMLIVAARRLIRQIVGDLAVSLDLTPHQFWVLMVLHDAGPMCLTELAGALWMDDPTISRMVKVLTENGLLKVEPDPNHGRRIVISLSAEGEKLWTRLAALNDEFRVRFEKGLSASEKTTLRKCLVQAMVNLEDMQHDVIAYGTLEEQPKPKPSRYRAMKARRSPNR